MKIIITYLLLLVLSTSNLRGQSTLLLSKTDSICVEHDYSFVMQLDDDLYLAKKSDEDFIINERGESKIDLSKYDTRFYSSFKDNLTQLRSRTTKKFGFVDPVGFLKIDTIYDDVGSYNEGLAIVNKLDKYGVIDSLGNKIIPIKYEGLIPAGKNLFVAKKNGYHNLIDIKEKIIKKLDFQKIRYFNKQLLTLENDNGKHIFNSVDLKISDKAYQDLGQFGDTLLTFKLDEKVGLMDYQENVKVESTYDRIGWIRYGGVTYFMKDKKYGIIDKIGNEIAPAEYENIRVNKYNIFAQKDGKYYLYDHDFKRIDDNIYKNLRTFGPCDTYLKAVSDDSTSYAMYPDGKEIFEGLYFHEIKEITENLLLAKIGNKWKFYEIGSAKTIGPFDYAEPFSTGLAIVGSEGKQYIINDQGEMKSAEYDEIKIQNGHFILRNEDKWGVQQISSFKDLPLIYDEVNPLSQGIFIAVKDGKYGLVKEQKTLIPFENEYLESNTFRNDIKITREGKIGFADSEGKILIEPKFKSVISGIGTSRIVETEEGKGILDNDFKYEVDPIYEDIKPERMYNTNQSPFYKVLINGLWGFLNEAGKEIIRPQYRWIQTYKNTEYFAAVEMENTKWYFIDDNGKVILDQSFQYFLPSPYTRLKNRFRVSNGQLWGITDQNLNVIIPMVFNKITGKKENWEIQLGNQTILINDNLECIENCENLEAFKSHGIVKLK